MSKIEALRADDARGRSNRSPDQPARKRNAGRTQEAILNAAEAEFCKHGFNGARVDKIAKRSRSNTRMIYHYFKNKENLYLACLERIYVKVRTEEARLDLKHEPPAEGMAKLVEFTAKAHTHGRQDV